MPYWTRAPVVWTCHDLIPEIFPHYFSLAKRLVFAAAMRLALGSASVIFAPSRQTADDLIRLSGVDPARIAIAHPGLPARFAPQTESATTTLKARLGLPDAYVLYLGGNKPHKNLPALLQAWRSLIEAGCSRDACLVIAGAWDRRYPEARELAEELGVESSVRFLGRVSEEDLPTLYSGATVFVFPSLYEGFGLPLLEAMACGAPVACSKTSVLPEVAGEAAAYFDPGRPDEIARVVAGLLKDDLWRTQLRRLGLAQAASFQWEGTARMVVEVYRRFL
jgi:alpha-1,3-rhamnosyl/mannosyltransferase